LKIGVLKINREVFSLTIGWGKRFFSIFCNTKQNYLQKKKFLCGKVLYFAI